MKIKIKYAGGKEATKIVQRVPYEGEPFEGEIVQAVTQWERPVGGCIAFVVLARPEQE